MLVGAERVAIIADITEPRLSFSFDVIDLRTLNGELLLENDSLADSLIALLCRLDDQQQGGR